jgi:hypothetical protein
MKKNLIKTICSTLIIVSFLFIALASGETESNSSENKQVEKINCAMCGKDLTNDFNRICPNGGAYYCTAQCYQKLKKEVSDDLESEGYKRIDN